MSDLFANLEPNKKPQPWYRQIREFALDGGIALALLLLGGLSLTATRRMAKILVFLGRPFLAGSIRIIEANLKIAFPEKNHSEITALRRKNLCFMVELACDFLLSLKHPERINDRIISVQIPAEYPDDQPLIFCSPHLGNWEILARIIPRTGRRCAVVTGTLSSLKLNTLLRNARSVGGAELISHVGAAFKVKAAIKANKTVGLLIDQNISPKHGGMFSNFFSLPAPTSRLPASIAIQEKVAIVSGACVKQADGNFTLCLQPLPKPAWEYSGVAELTAAILETNAQLIRRYPEQYLWIYRRWRYIPANLAPELRQRFPFYAEYNKYLCPEEILNDLQEDSKND